MSNQAAKAIAKAQKPALQRLDKHEDDIKALMQGMQQGFGLFDQKIRTLEEIIDVVVGLVGADKVAEAISARRAEQDQQESDNEKKGLEMAKAKDMIVVGVEVNEKSIIVGHEVDSDGQTTPPGRSQLLFNQVKADLKAGLLGKKVGEGIDTPVGGKFVIDELWDIVAKPSPAAQEAAVAAVEAALGTDLQTPAGTTEVQASA